MSNLGCWDRWYDGLTEPAPYGLTETYALGASFLAPCALVEDWGCGKGWFRAHGLRPGQGYGGIDGSKTPFADVIADLASYRSRVPGIFIRHVLEHDYRWRQILANAVASFTERLVLVLFTPMQDETRELAFAPDPGVPDLGFAEQDIAAFFDGCQWRAETLATATQYGTETIFFVGR